MAVTISNTFSEPRELISNLINSSVIDPKTAMTNSRRRWIYREFPDTTSRDFGGYPFLVIPSGELDEDVQSMNGCLSSGDIEIPIEIYVEFNDTLARVDTLSDAIFAVFRNKANRDALLKENLSYEKLTGGPFDSQDEDGKQISTRKLTLMLASTLQEV